MGFLCLRSDGRLCAERRQEEEEEEVRRIYQALQLISLVLH